MSVAVQPLPKEKILYYPGPSYFVGRMTYEEYIAFEESATGRHELIDGRVYAMPRGTPAHSLISANMLRSLGNLLEANNLDCDAYTSDQKVYVKSGQGLYPDLTVSCGEAEFDSKNALLNPALIVEVLSPSSAGYDRGLKFEKYQKISSLRHYFLITQGRVSVTHYEKIAGNLWAIVGIHNDLEQGVTLTLSEATMSIPLTAIYRRVEIPQRSDDAEADESGEGME